MTIKDIVRRKVNEQATVLFEFAGHDFWRISVDGLRQAPLGLRSVYGRVGGGVDQDVRLGGLDEIPDGCWLGQVTVGRPNGDEFVVGRGKVTSQFKPNLAVFSR